jgi:hypothetical protein
LPDPCPGTIGLPSANQTVPPSGPGTAELFHRMVPQRGECGSTLRWLVEKCGRNTSKVAPIPKRASPLLLELRALPRCAPDSEVPESWEPKSLLHRSCSACTIPFGQLSVSAGKHIMAKHACQEIDGSQSETLVAMLPSRMPLLAASCHNHLADYSSAVPLRAAPGRSFPLSLGEGPGSWRSGGPRSRRAAVFRCWQRSGSLTPAGRPPRSRTRRSSDSRGRCSGT